jgi:hypothetical protein
MQPQTQETRAQESQPQEQPPRVQQPPPAASTVRTRTRRKTDWSHRKAILLPEITQFASPGGRGEWFGRRAELQKLVDSMHIYRPSWLFSCRFNVSSFQTLADEPLTPKGRSGRILSVFFVLCLKTMPTHRKTRLHHEK